MYEPQRLHPLSILDFLIRHVYSLLQALLPLFLLALAQVGSRPWIWLAIPLLLIIFIIYGVLYWLRYLFYLSEQELRLEYGVFIRKQRHIPFERIQSVQISAGILQRMFGLVKVQVETAGGGNKAEFVLAALSRTKAEALREILQSSQNLPDQDEEKPVALEYHLSARSLLLLASTSNGMGVALSALLVIVSQLDDFFSGLHIWIKIGQYAENLATGKISMVILAVLILLLLAWLMSLVGTIIRFSGFQLVREGENIIVSRGLLEKQQLTLPIKRIQAIRVVEGVLRQPFGMVSVQVVSISNSASAKGEGNVLFPLLPRVRLEQFLQETAPEFAMTFNPRMLPVSARRRYLLITTLPMLIIASLAAFFLPWGYLAFLIVPLATWLGNAQYKASGWQLEADKLLFRSRVLGRVTNIVPRRRIQSMDISQHFFQQRLGLTTLCLAVASGLGGTLVKLKGMDEKHSREIAEWFSGR